MTNYRVQVTTKVIDRGDIVNVGDTFLAAPQLFGDVLVHASRPKDSVGVMIAAFQIDSPRRSVWETHLAVPASRVSVNSESKTIEVVTAAGALFELGREALNQGMSDSPKTIARSTQGALSFTDQIELPGGKVAFYNTADPTQLMTYDPAARQGLSIVSLTLPDGRITARPSQFQGNLLFPSNSGEVTLIDPASGKPASKPFRPSLEPGQKVEWTGAAPIGNEFVIADDNRNIFRVTKKDSPAPFLDQAANNVLEIDLESTLAAVGDTVYGVVRGPSSDVVVALNVKDLKVAKEIDLEGKRVTWGPITVGNAVLLAADNREIHCFEAGQKTRWKSPAPAHGKPAGPPLVSGDNFIFASLNGVVWTVDAGTGKENTKFELGEPLASSPVAFGSRLLLCGNDGAVHVISMPDGS